MTESVNQPPQISTRFLNWALPESLREPVLGDLSEEFFQQSVSNPIAAKNWYRKQALKSALQFLWQTKRGLLMFILSILVFVGFAIAGMALSGGIDMFIDIPSFMLVIPACVVFAIAATSVKDFKTGFSLLVNDEQDVTKKEIKSAATMFRVMGNTAVLSGIATTLIGAVAIGSNLIAENFSTDFGPAFAVCILTLLYGFMIKTIAYVAEQKLLNKIDLFDD